YLGLDRITGDTSSGDAVDETELEEPPDLRDGGRMPSVPSAMPSEPEPEPDDGSTTDEGGGDPPTSPSKDPETPPPASSAGDGGGFTPPSVVVPLTPSLILPNHFEQVLGVSDDDVTSRIETVFQQLFHGNPDQVIYYELDDDNAYVVDVANGDTRIDALGYGLMFTVQLDHQPEFDKIWHYTKTYFENQAGPLAGYLRWSCEFDGQTCDSQVGVFGAFYVITAL